MTTKVGDGITIQFRDGDTKPVAVKDLEPGDILEGEGFPDEGPHVYETKRVNQHRTDILWHVDGKLRRRKVMLHGKRTRAQPPRA